jgi:hypothetical protein
MLSFKDIYSRSWNTPLKHKYFEFQLMRDSEYLLNFNFNWKTKCDHAGVNLELGLFGYELMLCVYDNRHWDDKTNDWVV